MKKFKVGEEVINRLQQIGKVLNTDSSTKWNDIPQPVLVIFPGVDESQKFYSIDGTYHPGKVTKLDIRPLTKLEKAMK